MTMRSWNSLTLKALGAAVTSTLMNVPSLEQYVVVLPLISVLRCETGMLADHQSKLIVEWMIFELMARLETHNGG